VEYSPMTPMTDDFNPFVPRHRINPFGLILWLDFHVLFVCRKFFVHRIDPKGAILWIEIKSARLCAPRNLFHRIAPNGSILWIRASPSVTLPPKVTY
jgi:hypothetical protein